MGIKIMSYGLQFYISSERNIICLRVRINWAFKIRSHHLNGSKVGFYWSRISLQCNELFAKLCSFEIFFFSYDVCNEHSSLHLELFKEKNLLIQSNIENLSKP